MGKQKVEFEAVLTKDQLVAALQSLACGVQEGTLCLEHEGRFVVLNPTDLVKLELSAAEKKGKSKIELEISWKADMTVKGAPTELKISSVVPEAAAKAAEDDEDEEDDKDDKEEHKAAESLESAPKGPAAE